MSNARVMPYRITLTASEEVIANIAFSPSSKSESVRIAVSNQALYLPRKKVFAKIDPSYFERVSIAEVLEVHIEKIKPIWSLLIAFAMVITGVALSAIMIWPFLHGENGGVSGYPPAIAICGLVIPFIVRNRYKLIVSAGKKSFRWKPPLLIDRPSRQNTQSFFDVFVDACQKAGISTVDDRPRRDALANSRTPEHNHPLAGLPDDLRLGSDAQCTNCGKSIRISRWESWNKFLVECPHCHGVNGGHWKVYSVLLASLFLNAPSFFFTMRPKIALMWTTAFGVLWTVLLYTEQRWTSNDLLQLSLFIVAIMGPVAVNSVVALRHEAVLSRAKLYRE